MTPKREGGSEGSGGSRIGANHCFGLLMGLLGGNARARQSQKTERHEETEASQGPTVFAFFLNRILLYSLCTHLVAQAALKLSVLEVTM